MLEFCKLCDGIRMLYCLTVSTVFSSYEKGFGISLGLKLSLKILYADNIIAVSQNYFFLITDRSTESINISFGDHLHQTVPDSIACFPQQLIVLHNKYEAQGQPGSAFHFKNVSTPIRTRDTFSI